MFSSFFTVFLLKCELLVNIFKTWRFLHEIQFLAFLEKSGRSELAGLSYLLYFILPMWRRQWHPTPLFFPGNSHGRKSLVGCNPWDREESDMAEQLHFHFSLSCTGEGNVNPLQHFCLETPRDRGAWWAAVYGVAQSQTQLKRLSSSSSIIIFRASQVTQW